MEITCTTPNWETVSGTIDKETWTRIQTAQLIFYYFKWNINSTTGWIWLDKNENIQNFQFKKDSNGEIFNLLNNVVVDRNEGLCNEIRQDRKPVILHKE